jgi:hypothetical protein
MILKEISAKISIMNWRSALKVLQLGTLQIPENFKLLLYRNGE